MRPVVILDTNAINGRKPFAGPHMSTLLSLALAGKISLVVPEVVLLEASRQYAEELRANTQSLRAALGALNEQLRILNESELCVGIPEHDRESFYERVESFLHEHNVETPPPPLVSVRDLLYRDISGSKPFKRDGKGFRDALTWHTVVQYCRELGDPTSEVIFVTNDSDFRKEKTDELHPDLRRDLDPIQTLHLAQSPYHAQKHPPVNQFVHLLPALTFLTADRLKKLVDYALSRLDYRELDVYVGDGYSENPIDTVLSEPEFDEIIADDSTIEYEVFRVGGDEQSTVIVTVEADFSIVGFADWGDLDPEFDEVTIIGGWNRHVVRASEAHRMQFTLSARFDPASVTDFALSVDQVDEIPRGHSAGQSPQAIDL